MALKMKRIYEKASNDDGIRILVDRLWPRGVRKQDANVDCWLKHIAPTTELRKWFGHDPNKYEQFKEKYKYELKENAEQKAAFLHLKQLINNKENITLLYAAKDEQHNHVQVLMELLLNKKGITP